MNNTDDFNEKEKEVVEKFIATAFKMAGALMHFPVRDVADPAVLSLEAFMKSRGFKTDITTHPQGGALLNTYTVPKPLIGSSPGIEPFYGKPYQRRTSDYIIPAT